MSIQLSEHFGYGKLLRFTLPSVIMMIVTSVYLVVDGFFISNFAGKTAFSAVNLVIPVLMILGTVGFMFGAGGTALVAKTYGEGDRDRANRYFSLLVYVAFATGAVLGVIGFAFARPISELLGADGEMLENAVTYSRIISLALPFFVLEVMFQNFFSAAEKPTLGLIITLAAGLTNVALDAVLVVFLPFEYKLIGAAFASVFSQIVGAVIPYIYFCRENSSILRICKTRFDRWAILKVLANGSSEFMTNIAVNLVGILYNIQLMRFEGQDGVAAYGVMMYVSMIFSSVFVGFSMGSAPIVGYHDGAGNHSELKSILKKSIYIISVSGMLMLLSAELLAEPISLAFVGYDKRLLDMTVSGMRIFALSFAFLGFGIFVSGFFTALNDGLTSAIIAFLRTVVFQSAAILILPELFEINGVWISVIVAEFMAFALGVIFLIAKKKKFCY